MHLAQRCRIAHDDRRAVVPTAVPCGEDNVRDSWQPSVDPEVKDRDDDGRTFKAIVTPCMENSPFWRESRTVIFIQSDIQFASSSGTQARETSSRGITEKVIGS